jgi:hypothetical protein
MKKSHLKPQMTSTTTSTSTSVSAITTTTMSTPSDNNIIKTKIENATVGLSSNCFNHLYNRILPASRENALTICDYISLKSEINPSDHYRKDTIILLCNLSTFFKNAKSFKEIMLHLVEVLTFVLDCLLCLAISGA